MNNELRTMNNELLRDYSETVPIQYQEKKARFMDMDIAVDPRVFIPRPETELLVREVTAACRENDWVTSLILDIGTGSGVIPLGLAQMMEACRVVAVDISPDALAVANENIRRFRCERRITLIRSDMFSALGEEHVGVFDVIVSNPPYVSHKDYLKVDAWVKAEPKIALYGGEDGMDYYRAILRDGLWFLKNGGILAVEVGYDQCERVKGLFAKNGLADIKSSMDINGHERIIMGRKNG